MTTKTAQITITESTKIARKVLRYLSTVNSFNAHVEEQIDGHLAGIGLGWKLKPGTYIDNVARQLIGQMAKDIRSSAIEIYGSAAA